jgi:hypothetical protein
MRARWRARAIWVPRRRQCNPTGKSAKVCLVSSRKIFRLTHRANQRYQLARLTRQEGRLAIVTNVRWDAVDADVTTDDRGFSRTVKSCGPGAPMLALSSQQQELLRATVARKPVTGESSK